MKRICVIGTGYVGLVTGTCFADLGNSVVCLDIVPEKIARLRAGEMPIFEPGLEQLVRRNTGAGRLTFTTQHAEAVPSADFIFIAVDTPTISGGAGADMSRVESAARAIAQHLSGPAIIVNKSTMPVGSGDLVSDIVSEHLSDTSLHVAVVSNPEFLREGSAVHDFLHPDRVVLGSTHRAAAEQVAQLYLPLRAPIMITDLYTAEMIKYASNAFLATKISFINEIARICDLLGADVTEVAEGMGYDTRIGRAHLNAGLGFGGSCFEADETIFALNSPHVAAERIDTLFAQGGKPLHGDVVELVMPEAQRVLAFDLGTGQPTLAQVRAITRRPYVGAMVTINTALGRSMRVTADHPVVLHRDGAFAIVPAARVAAGDQLMALCALPAVEQAATLNLIDLLRGTALEEDVFVTPVDDAFTRLYRRFALAIPSAMARYPHEIKRHNRMSLPLFRHLRDAGLLDVPEENLLLYTAKGAATPIAAVIPMDADLLRLCGYYLAEGYISQDAGRGVTVRERVGFGFHENEVEYIADVRRILGRWGLKWIERNATHATTAVVSSRLFAWLLRDVLHCGTRSEDKALPRLALNVAPELRYELVRGAFSGDGAVTPVQDGHNLMLEYATVSKPLADGMTLLLQTLGVVPAVRTRWMNKSMRPAFIVRVSGYESIVLLKDVFGEKRREQIAALLAGYQRHIQPHGYVRCGAFATLMVCEVRSQDVDTTVYSLETTTGTVITSSGLISHNCFPKDVKALAHMADVAGLHPQLLEAVLKINADQRHSAVDRLEAALGGPGSLDGRRIAVLGLAFADNTDDMREAPAIDIINWLLAAGATVRAYDPQAVETARRLFPGWERDGRVTHCADEYDAAAGCEALLVVTDWKRFRQVDPKRLRAAMVAPAESGDPVLIDGRNLYDPEEMRLAGFRYEGIGRGVQKRHRNGRPTGDKRAAKASRPFPRPARRRAPSSRSYAGPRK